MRIKVTFEVDDEYADPSHEMGLTEEGYLLLSDAIPGDDIQVERLD